MASSSSAGLKDSNNASVAEEKIESAVGKKRTMSDTKSSMSSRTKKRKCGTASVEKEVHDEVDKFKARINTEALRIIHKVFPDKIHMMHELYKRFRAEQFKYTQSTTVTFLEMPSNEHVELLYVRLKNEILEMVDSLNLLRLWLRLKVPKHQTGNNFRTEVLAEVLSMLGSGRLSGLSVLEVVAKYFLRRAKYVSDAKKYPRSEDMARMVTDLDEKQYICLIQGAMGLRNTFMLLADKFKKNFSHILDSGASNARNAKAMVF